MTTIKTTLTPRGRKIRSIKDQSGKTHYCFTDVCHALRLNPERALGKLRYTLITTFPIKVHKNHDTTRFLAPEGFAVLSREFSKPEAMQLLDYLSQDSISSEDKQQINNTISHCLPVIKLMLELRKFRDGVATAFHSIYGDDKEMEEAADYIEAQSHIANAITSLSNIAGKRISDYINYC